MASNKNQHFVPRCYLRPFTADADQKTIHLFNVDRQAVIRNAPIKTQCSRDYFYGTNEALETAIQSVEGAYASILPDLLQGRTALQPLHRIVIPRFWYLQQTRTEASSKRAVEISEETDALIGHPDESFKMEIKQAVQLALGIYAQNLDVLDDLKIVLIRNRTQIPFVTSDDPAVLVNRWHATSDELIGSGYGLTSAGLICLLPLSPNVFCVAYDGSVYSVPHQENWIDLRDGSDVDSLNDLQFLNCVANVYFNNAADEPYLFELHRRNSHRRPTKRHLINYAVEDSSSNGYTRFVVVDKSQIPEHERALIHMMAIRVQPNRWPSFLRWRPGGFVYSNDTGLGHVRRAHVPLDYEKPFKKLKTGY